ncbi:TetR/AcrR family transcriptional regulator [Streptomyces sp. CYG20]|nr:TetR/AcrR family transcriptional regulator [Streptomyces sp. COG21]MBT3101798.1 TetR/AcrR family transcriptional regulator [Streptomyces sp. COG19]MBT3110083.1 TetR/AcrR family transcriptional regulator [Streptomyces sp. CYG20]
MTAQGDTEPPKGRPKDPRVDAALLDAAIEVLNESGWAAFTTTAVARRAGASTASLYRRWPSKQALAGAVARHIALDGLGGIDTGSLEGDVRELLSAKRRILENATGPALLSLMGQAPARRGTAPHPPRRRVRGGPRPTGDPHRPGGHPRRTGDPPRRLPPRRPDPGPGRRHGGPLGLPHPPGRGRRRHGGNGTAPAPGGAAARGRGWGRAAWPPRGPVEPTGKAHIELLKHQGGKSADVFA